MSNNLPKLISIIGPTASGKTDAGIYLASKIGGEIISADSRPIYTDLNIGTAKSEMENDTLHNIHTANKIDNVNHYLFNISRPDKQLTLAQWQKSAFEIIDNLISKDVAPLLVGGTMLYVDSVVFNYNIPHIEVDKQLRNTLENKNTDILFAELIEKDPQSIEFIQPQNKRRIIRALEVIAATNQPFSQQRKTKPPKYDNQIIGIFPGWDELSDRISKRVRQMIEEGLVDEIKLLQSKYGTHLPLLRTINYKQIATMLTNEITKKEAIDEMIRANHRYARRQMSWWRGRKDITWIESPKQILRLL